VQKSFFILLQRTDAVQLLFDLHNDSVVYTLKKFNDQRSVNPINAPRNTDHSGRARRGAARAEVARTEIERPLPRSKASAAHAHHSESISDQRTIAFTGQRAKGQRHPPRPDEWRGNV
jgi:hypothetical protein